MHGTSRPVSTNQAYPHRGLGARLARHLTTPFLSPVKTHNLHAFQVTHRAWRRHQGALVLDSGCGIGESTRILAERHPQAFVVGIDKSRHRLYQRTGGRPIYLKDNYALVRADLVDFWRLAKDAGWHLARHYLLYPNPWPKQKHLKRRWHAHPVFPTLLSLGGAIELRSNWHNYALEFAEAIRLATGRNAEVSRFIPLRPLSPFEKKYWESRQALYLCRATLAP